MTRTVKLAMALALLTGSAAFAQTNQPAAGDAPPPPPAAGQPAVAGDTPPPPPSQGGSGDMSSDDDHMGISDDEGGPHGAWRRHDWKHHGGGRDGRHFGGRGGPDRFGMDDRGPGRAGPGGSGDGGALFRFSAGQDGPSFTIRCAEGDTTKECADAVQPLIRSLMPESSDQL